MNDMTAVLIIAAVAIILCVLICVLITRNFNMHQQIAIRRMIQENADSENEKRADFQQHLNGQMLAYQNGMEDTMRAELSRMSQSSAVQLERLDARVNDSLMRGFEKTGNSFAMMKAEMARISAAQLNLQQLSSSIDSLQGILNDKKTRGTYGEVELYSLLEQVFGSNDARFQKQYHLSNGTIADAVILSPQPLGLICIDSKFPLENYNRMMDSDCSRDQQVQARNGFARDVRKHISDIADKYINPPETAEMAYLFVPAEAVFAEIYGHFDDVVQYSYQRSVYIVSPTTLMAYLTAIRAIYLGQQRNAKVEEIQQEYQKLSQEFERFEKRFTQVSSDFGRTYQDIHMLETTFAKMSSRFADINAVRLNDREGSNSETED